MKRASLLVVPLAAMCGCASPAEPPVASAEVVVAAAPASSSASSHAGVARSSAPACCKDFEEIKAHDGKRIAFEGVYERTAVMKRGGDEEADKKARTVQIVGGGTSVMLEIYYRPKGVRDVAEIEKFQGKRVRVVGTLTARTPTQMEGDIPMQTMIGPAIVDIESIEAI